MTAPLPGTQWIPSNGSIGQSFLEHTCGACRNNSKHNPCPIIDASFWGKAVEWRRLPDNNVVCVKFEAKADQSKAPPPDCFRVGDWWLSPDGTRYLVVDRKANSFGCAVGMRAGGSGRTRYRLWDSVITKAGSWVRESWGGQE